MIKKTIIYQTQNLYIYIKKYMTAQILINMRLSSIKNNSVCDSFSLKFTKNMSQSTPQYSKQTELLQNLLNSEQQGIQRQLKIRDFLSKHSIDNFFDSLQKYIDHTNLCNIRKNQRLQDGLYIVLSGGIVGFFMQQKERLSAGQRQLREHLFVQLKSGNYASIFGSQNKKGYSYFKGQSSINSRFILLGLKMFDVFQCIDMNFITVENSLLLKIDRAVQAQTKYQALKRVRSSIMRSNFLPIICKNNQLFESSKSSQQPFIQILPQFHQNIDFKTFKFRNIIRVDYFGIIVKGIAKNIDQKSKKVSVNCNLITQTQLISQKALIFEGISYEIFCFKDISLLKQSSQLIINHFIKLKKQGQQIDISDNVQVKQSSKNKTSSYMTLNTNSKQFKNRTKQMVNAYKQYQKYSIIPMFTCLRSLNFSKQLISKGKTKTKKTQNPLVLFDLISNQIKKGQLKFDKEKMCSVHKKKQRTCQKSPSRSPTVFERINKRLFKTCSSSFYEKQNFQNIKKKQSKSIHFKQPLINMPLQLKPQQSQNNQKISKLYKFRIDKKMDQFKLRTQHTSKTVIFQPNFKD